MVKWQTFLGVAIGLAGAMAILALVKSAPDDPTVSTGAILSECDGRIRSIVIQYTADAAEISGPVYRSLLPQLGPDVQVHVVCPDRQAYDRLVDLVGPVKCRLSPVIVNHPMTTWSRDRWVALAGGRDGKTTLVASRAESAAGLWPARAGDQRMAADLAVAMPDKISAARSELRFDGGDFLADQRHVFVTSRVLRNNLQNAAHDRQQLIARLQTMLHRKVILLDDAPDHHAAMFMMTAGNNTMLVGDPSLARKALGHGEATTEALKRLPGGADWSDGIQRKCDAVADQCRAAGYRIIRIPLVPSCDGRTFLTYVNCLIDSQGSQRIVYMPVFRGFGELNLAAKKVWLDLGFEVREVDCTSTYRHFGNLHCLVNVLERS